MSEQPALEPVPRWDTADRMRKALRASGVSVQQMADYLDVTRRSVGNWLSGRIDPSSQTLRLWALKTGVPFEWLCHGDTRPCDIRPRGVPSTRRRGMSNYMHFFAEMPSQTVAA